MRQKASPTWRLNDAAARPKLMLRKSRLPEMAPRLAVIKDCPGYRAAAVALIERVPVGLPPCV